jgi:RNA polymerase sigma-70 factor (ECF subfamily)
MTDEVSRSGPAEAPYSGPMSAERALRAIPRPSDAALVAAGRQGESRALEALYRQHVGAVFGLARRLLGTDEDVDDVTQDTFIAALGNLERLRDPDAFRSWVLRIAVGKVCRVIRKRRLLATLGLRTREAPPDLDQLLAPSAPPDTALELKRIYDAVVALPTDVRVALLLRRVEGATLEEIAGLTGCSLATVKRRVARGDAALSATQEPDEGAASADCTEGRLEA